MTPTAELIHRYFNAFNARDFAAMAALVAEDMVHHENQGGRLQGRERFQAFCTELSAYYHEQLSQLVVMVCEDGTRAAAEFMVDGTYTQSAPGLPPATGQTYRLPAGTFFEIKDGLIRRVTTYYNLQEWLRQIGG